MATWRWSSRVLTGVGLVLLTAGVASAQVSVALPDSSQTTTLTAAVSEQARVVVPATITFNVTDLSAATAAGAASITVDRIVLATATKQFKISLQAGASSFTPPVVGGTTWSDSDVSWNAASWTNATGSSGTLSSASFNTVATSTAGTSTCSTTGLILTLAAKASVNRAGNHTLSVTWKFESIGS